MTCYDDVWINALIMSYIKGRHRIKQLYNGIEEFCQYDKRNTLTAYTKEGVTSQYEYDNAGNLLKDDKARYAYDAWGNLTACEEKVQNRFKFNGQQYDPIIQQYYLRARYYNPVTGRFTQEDSYNVDGHRIYCVDW